MTGVGLSMTGVQLYDRWSAPSWWPEEVAKGIILVRDQLLFLELVVTATLRVRCPLCTSWSVLAPPLPLGGLKCRCSKCGTRYMVSDLHDVVPYPGLPRVIPVGRTEPGRYAV